MAITLEKEQAVRPAAKDVEEVEELIRKGVEEAFKGLSFDTESTQMILENGDHVSSEVGKFLKGLFSKLTQKIIGCLKLISGGEELILDPTDGTELITERSDIFNGHIDSDFRNYRCNVNGQPTGPTKVQVWEMIEDGDFKKIYGFQSRELDLMSLTHGQIIGFVKKYRNWLRTDGWATFFLLKVGDEFFVVLVFFVVRGELDVGVYRFSLAYGWSADGRHRFVVPQPALGS